MNRLKQLLASTATKVLGGMAIAAALIATAVEMNYSRHEWNVDTAPHRDEQTWRTFYIAIPDGTPIPKAWPEGDDGRVLGDCAGGECCIDDFCYRYRRGQLVADYRLIEVFAPPYFASGWRQWANDTAGVHWFWSFMQVKDACLGSGFTPSQCLNLLALSSQCLWLDTNGNGILDPPADHGCNRGVYADAPTESGLNGGACPYADVIALRPCTVNRGAGSELTDSLKEWTETDLD